MSIAGSSDTMQRMTTMAMFGSLGLDHLRRNNKRKILCLGKFFQLLGKTPQGNGISGMSQDIFSLCHVFSNRHKYRISNTELFLPESEREESDNNKSTNNTNCKVVDPQDVSFTTLAKELEDPEDIPLATLQAQLSELDDEDITLDHVMAQFKKYIPVIHAGDGQVET